MSFAKTIEPTERPLNIMFVCSSRKWGGNEKWTRMAAHGLGTRHQVTVACRRPVVGDQFNVPVHYLPFYAPFDVYTLFRLVKLIRKYNVDVLIPTKRKDYILCGIASRVCKVKNVLRLGIVRRLGINPLNRLIYCTFADGIIVNAMAVRDSLLQSSYIEPQHVHTIYNGLDLQRIDAEQSNGVESPPFAAYIASMGGLTQRKGFDFLLQAFAHFQQKHPTSKAGLVFIGGGEQDWLQKLAHKLGISEYLHFTGFCSNPYPWLATADIYVQASRNEGMSNALLEGMYCGCAAISTRAGGSAEIIYPDENGYLVDYGDILALSGAIENLIFNSDKRVQVAQAGKETVARCFSMEAMMSALEQTLRKICKVP